MNTNSVGRNIKKPKTLFSAKTEKPKLKRDRVWYAISSTTERAVSFSKFAFGRVAMKLLLEIFSPPHTRKKDLELFLI